MKKYFFLLALVLAPLAFISCSDDDEGGSGSVTLKAGKTSEDAIKLEIPSSEQPEITLTIGGKKKIIKVTGIELTEDAKYLLSYIDVDALPVREETRGKLSEAISYLLGNFSKEGAKYVLQNVGTIDIAANGDNYKVTLISEDQAEYIVNNALKIVMSGWNPSYKQLTTYIGRNWTIKEYQLRGEIKGTKVARDWNGTCDLNKVAEYANSKGANINIDFKGKEVIEGIFFSKNGTFQINYKDTDKKDVGNWWWTKVNNQENTGELLYEWNNAAEMGNDILAGVASVKFEGSTCKLYLNAEVNTGDADNVQVMFLLK